MKKKSGFTLIEVLAVLVILGLLISFSVVSVSKIKKKQDIENRINVIRSILTAARNYEADNPNTQPSTGVSVSILLIKNYVDFDTTKYADLIKNESDDFINVKWDSVEYETNSFSREFYIDSLLNGVKYTDCGLETEQGQDANTESKKLCVKGGCVDVTDPSDNKFLYRKCNGWNVKGKANNVETTSVTTATDWK